HKDDEVEEGWEVIAPMDAALSQKDHRIVGAVRVFISIQLIKRVASSLSNIILIVGAIGGLSLFLLLMTALRRTIENDRRLHEVETRNIDLSEQLHEAERNLMNLEKFSVLGQLTGTFAHEIGTPLNAITGHLTLLKEDVISDKPNLDSRFSILEGQVSKIAGIVKNFLQTTAQPPSELQLIDANQLIEKSLTILGPRLELLQVKVQRHLDRGLGPIRIAPLELEQVLINIINNAIDAIRMKPGQVGGILELSTGLNRRDDAEWLEIRVRDNGMGIPEKDLKKVLRPFYTTKTPAEGTGLGLSICADLLAKVDGNLSVASVENEWTLFTISIPFVHTKESDS
ncbi:MAG: HAMP domain-containing histidine kinase, partial [Proteobacteria bacterium]